MLFLQHFIYFKLIFFSKVFNYFFKDWSVQRLASRKSEKKIISIGDYWRPPWTSCLRPPDFCWRPSDFHRRTPHFHQRPHLFTGDPIFDGHPTLFFEDPLFTLEPPDLHWRPQIFSGDPQISVDP